MKLIIWYVMVLIQQITNDRIAMYNHKYEHTSHDMLA